MLRRKDARGSDEGDVEPEGESVQVGRLSEEELEGNPDVLQRLLLRRREVDAPRLRLRQQNAHVPRVLAY